MADEHVPDNHDSIEPQRMHEDIRKALGWEEYDTTDTQTWHMLVNAVYTNRVMLAEAGEYRAYAEGAGKVMMLERERAEAATKPVLPLTVEAAREAYRRSLDTHEVGRHKDPSGIGWISSECPRCKPNLEALLRAVAAAALDDKRCWCGKRWPEDGYADEALCFGPDGKWPEHDHETPRQHADRLAEPADKEYKDGG